MTLLSAPVLRKAMAAEQVVLVLVWRSVVVQPKKKKKQADELFRNVACTQASKSKGGGRALLVSYHNAGGSGLAMK